MGGGGVAGAGDPGAARPGGAAAGPARPPSEATMRRWFRQGRWRRLRRRAARPRRPHGAAPQGLKISTRNTRNTTTWTAPSRTVVREPEKVSRAQDQGQGEQDDPGAVQAQDHVLARDQPDQEHRRDRQADASTGTPPGTGSPSAGARCGRRPSGRRRPPGVKMISAIRQAPEGERRVRRHQAAVEDHPQASSRAARSADASRPAAACPASPSPATPRSWASGVRHVLRPAPPPPRRTPGAVPSGPPGRSRRAPTVHSPNEIAWPVESVPASVVDVNRGMTSATRSAG